MKRGAVYARLSDVRKDDVEGIERQLREARAHAEKLGITVVEELVDNDLSAAKKKTRPSFERLMAGISANAWDVVVLRSLDRWVRRPAELERIIDEVERSKVKVEAIHGIIDLRTPQGRLQARMMTAVAMHEVEQTAQRVTDWHADRAARGLSLHGKAGFGYRRPKGSRDTELVVEEAELVRAAARRVLAGEPIAAICREWNAAGIRGPGPAGEWIPNTLRTILVSPRTAGLRALRGEIVGTAQWPPILDRETWERVVRYVNAASRIPTGSRATNLLTGIARCGKPGCGKPLNCRSADQGARRYWCRHCHGIMVVAEPLERLVEAMLFDAVDSPHLGRTLRRLEAHVDTGAIAEEVVRLETELTDLAAELGEGRLTMQEWKIARAGIEARLVALRAELGHDTAASALAPYAGRKGALRAAWQHDDENERLSLPEKRRILSAVFEAVEILPARRGARTLDPDRVNPLWR